MISRTELSSAYILPAQKGYVMTDKTDKQEQIEWITASQAARLPECQVTRKTLIRMIERGDVPQKHYQIIHLAGNRRIVRIDKNILPYLEYKGQGEYKRRKD